MEEQKIMLNGKRFFYRSIGEGPMVFLLHGFGEDGSIWNNQYEALPGFQLIIPDLPGSGKSEMINDMSMEGLAECILEFLQRLKIDQLSLIGHSMGGYITLAFAEKYPELLNGFGLFHSTAYADSEEKKQIRKKGIEFIQKHGAYDFLKTSIPNLYAPATKNEKPGLIENQITCSNHFSETALVSYYNSMMTRPNRTSVLKNSRLPVLFILGKHDNAVPLKDGLEQCSLPDLAYIHVLENAGHMGMREEPTASNQILLNYLKNLHHQTR